ncbi:MAG: 3-deoxy-7-phosphoheptulonate synthase, partial [Gammaproteobacteria bacterium]
MIVILHPDTDKSDPAYAKLMNYLAGLPGISVRTHDVVGSEQTLTEVYLVGHTATLDAARIQSFEVVERVVRVSREYRILGRHKDDIRPSRFSFNGVTFGQDNLHVFAGLCAVDNREHVEQMM